MILIPEESKNILSNIISLVFQKHGVLFTGLYNEIQSKFIENDQPRNDLEILNSVEDIISDGSKNILKEDLKKIRRALIAKFALNLPHAIRNRDLPKSITELYPPALTRLAIYLNNNENDTYDKKDDFFLKDICFVLGKTVPCGAQYVELNSYVLFRRTIRSLAKPENIKSIIKFIKIRGSGQWFRIHTEARYLNEFNEQGWISCYLRIAELLEKQNNNHGMVGTSWFYDPKLIYISPNLSYLQSLPLENGAFRIQHRSSAIDTERATLKSKNRKKLYEEGRYSPICCSIFWPRKELLSWAKNQI
jgi:hypothetical protein